MSKQTTPKYSITYPYIDFVNQRRSFSRQAWDGQHYGKPTTASVKRWVEDFNTSLKAGGNNAHLRAGMSDVSTATVRHNYQNGAVVAEYSAPMFQVI